jgi:polysaccharide deacetylase 2 family uncharacterized protein YibQ
MAKKGSAKPRARKKKKKKGVNPKLQLMKILSGVTLLVCLVVTAGLLANRFLMRPAPQVASKTQANTDYPARNRPGASQRPRLRSLSPGGGGAAAAHYPDKPITNGIPVAIIIDDIGYDRKMAEGFLELDVPLTFSVLPQGTFNHSIINQALKKDVEIMLHLPMEPGNYPSVNPGPGALLSTMNPDELLAQLNANLDRVPNVKGVNNHMGSKLTASSEQMRQIFTILKKRGLFFVDSRTSADTLCRPSAELLRLSFAERDVFIDHEQTPEFVKKQLKLLIKRANRQGYAIGIAHPHPVTLEVLKEMLPDLKKAVFFTHASKVVAFQQG